MDKIILENEHVRLDKFGTRHKSPVEESGRCSRKIIEKLIILKEKLENIEKNLPKLLN